MDTSERRTTTDPGDELPRHRDGEETAPGAELTRDEVIARETHDKIGRYDVRGPGGYRVKRFSRDYFNALDIEPPSWADLPPEVFEETSGAEGETPSPKIKVKQEPGVKDRGTFIPPRSSKERKAEAEQTAAVMLSILNGAVGMSLGPGAEMDPDEQAAVEGPLARILERMAPATNTMLSKWSDPVLLIFALGSWGARVYQDFQLMDRDDQGPGFEPYEPPEPRPGGNGRQVEADISANAEDVMAVINSGAAGV